MEVKIMDKEYPIEELEEAYKTINQLTNNWNELEEYIVKNKDYYGGITSEDILDKMKEIKDNN